MASSNQSLPCPFCPFEDDDLDFLQLHVQTLHPDRMELDNSTTTTTTTATATGTAADPFTIRESPEPREESWEQQRRDLGASSSSWPPSASGRSDSLMAEEDEEEEEEGEEDEEGGPGTGEREGGGEEDYIECFCGEFCLQADFDTHLEMHNAEQMSFDLNDSLCTELSSTRTPATTTTNNTTFIEEQMISTTGGTTSTTTISQHQTPPLHRPSSSHHHMEAGYSRSERAASSSKYNDRSRESHNKDEKKCRVPSDTASVRSRSGTQQPPHTHTHTRRRRRPKADKPPQRLGVSIISFLSMIRPEGTFEWAFSTDPSPLSQ